MHPSIEHSPAENHSNAVFCSTVGLRPRWTTLSISVPFVAMAATKASPSIIRHASATGMGPCPAISHTSPAATEPRSRAVRSTRTIILANDQSSTISPVSSALSASLRVLSERLERLGRSASAARASAA